MNVKYYQKHVDKLIKFNPTNISITRTSKVSDGYGGYNPTTETIEGTVSFYDKRGRREVITDIGTTYTGISITKILTRHDLDIKAGDTFFVDNVEYKVYFVKEFKGICKQIELEVIGNNEEYSRLQKLFI